MRNIAAFNKSAQEVVKLNRSNEVILLIQKYMQYYQPGDYFNALQNLGNNIGLEYNIIEIVSKKTGKAISFRAAINYHAGNPVNGKALTKKFMDAPFKSSVKCYDYMARQYIYTLMDIPKLAPFVFKTD